MLRFVLIKTCIQYTLPQTVQRTLTSAKSWFSMMQAFEHASVLCSVTTFNNHSQRQSAYSLRSPVWDKVMSSLLSEGLSFSSEHTYINANQFLFMLNLMHNFFNKHTTGTGAGKGSTSNQCNVEYLTNDLARVSKTKWLLPTSTNRTATEAR